MRQFTAVVASIVCAAGFTMAGQTTAFGTDEELPGLDKTAPGVATLESAAEAIYVDENGDPLPVDENGDPLPVDENGNPVHFAGMSSEESGTSEASIGCTPISGVDNPHISSRSSGPAVHSHGWWKRGTCDGNTAHVTVCLYEYFENTSGTEHYWEQKACSPHTQLKPGGGGGNRVTAHEDCDSRQGTSWRAHVTVDVDWEVDTPEVPRRQAVVPCRVN